MKRPIQFTIVTLLVVTAIVAGYLAGHTRGVDRGFEAGKNDWMQLPVFSKTYPVKTIVLARSSTEILNSQSNRPIGSRPLGGITSDDFSGVVADIKQHVFPIVWEQDPNTRIQPFVPGLSVVVTGNGAVHHEVERHLAVARLEAQQGLSDYHVPSE
jgi:hypothetical protein